jgi:hypothetical protein
MYRSEGSRGVADGEGAFYKRVGVWWVRRVTQYEDLGPINGDAFRQ